MKRTKIEVIRVNRRIVSTSSSDAPEDSANTDIDILLNALTEIVSPAEESRYEIDEGGVEILRPHSQPLRLRLSRMRECFSHRYKTIRSNKP